MASVHESLYFNPMMTNGVVHANVFGIKDWVTPYKISVLALLYDMTVNRTSLAERRPLNKLILPLQQSSDLTLGQFLKTVDECCPRTAYSVKLRLQELVEGELKDMEHFFTIFPTAFSDFDSDSYKTSVVGLFMRHMLLAYKKLSFSQVYKLYKSLQQYYHSEYAKPTHSQLDVPALLADDSDMDLTSTDETVGDKTEKEEADAPLHPSELHEDDAPSRGPLSQKQAEYFLARQAYLLKNDENKGLAPAALQQELNNMLKFNPDFTEAHYLSYLNSLRVQDVFLSAHSLLHYFDRLILSASDTKSDGDDGYGRSLRYAALNLASLHCHFGHYQQADLALQEAIRIAQESNDHVCLQHCLSWLYTLEQTRGSDSTVLTEDSVKMTAYFGLPYLASLGIQSLVQQGATQGKTAHKLMDALKDTDVLHWKHSLSELIEISLAQTTSIWRMYGKSTMSLLQAQLLLNMSSLEPVNFGVQQNNSEAFAVALCHLAELHAEQGLFGAASEILQHLTKQFPPHSNHAKLWMLCDLKIQFEKHMNRGEYHLAEPLVAVMAALDKTEGLYRKALVLKALNRSSEAYSVLQRLQKHCEATRKTEVVIRYTQTHTHTHKPGETQQDVVSSQLLLVCRVLLSTAQLHWESSGFSTSLPLLLQALEQARQHHLQALASEAVLHLAFTQLMLGVPEQALSLLQEALEPILAHGAVMDKGRALLLAARCQVALASLRPQGAPQTDQWCLALDTLKEAAAHFSQLDCRERLRDVHYLQAQLHHLLGQTLQRNRAAMTFRLLDQELQSPPPPISMRL